MVSDLVVTTQERKNFEGTSHALREGNYTCGKKNDCRFTCIFLGYSIVFWENRTKKCGEKKNNSTHSMIYIYLINAFHLVLICQKENI